MADTRGAADSVLGRLPGIRNWQEDFYRDLHEHPELSHQELATAGKVAERLRGFGFQVHDGVGRTGVVGILTNGQVRPFCCVRIWTRCPCSRRPGSITPAPSGPLTPTAMRCR